MELIIAGTFPVDFTEILRFTIRLLWIVSRSSTGELSSAVLTPLQYNATAKFSPQGSNVKRNVSFIIPSLSGVAKTVIVMESTCPTSDPIFAEKLNVRSLLLSAVILAGALPIFLILRKRLKIHNFYFARLFRNILYLQNINQQEKKRCCKFIFLLILC